MRQIEHDNILPFYGVSMTVSDFSLVFPWYRNGNIKQYLEKDPSIDRYDLASALKLTVYLRHSHRSHQQLLGVIKGLLFFHSNRVVHGALGPVCETLLLLMVFNMVNRDTY